MVKIHDYDWRNVFGLSRNEVEFQLPGMCGDIEKTPLEIGMVNGASKMTNYGNFSLKRCTRRARPTLKTVQNDVFTG